MNVSFQLINPNDKEIINFIAQWYLNEWKIPSETTIQKISSFPKSGMPFQYLLSLDNTPVATGGLYHDVALLTIEPRFKKFDPWLALLYTIPEARGKGLGALLCEKIENKAKELSISRIYLYTFTAENLYLKLNWKPIERINYKGKDVVVMEKEL